MKVTFVHYADGESEVGIQFESDDGAGGTVTGRMFAPADSDLKARVLADAQSKLDAATGDLVNLPPGQVTTALMQVRNAKQEAQKAGAQRAAAEQAKAAAERAAQEAEARRAKASAEMAAALAAVEEAKATKATIDAEIEAAKAAAATVEEAKSPAADPSPR